MVANPAMLTLSKFVCPSTSISALISKLPPKVDMPVTFKDTAVVDVDTSDPSRYLLVPVPTLPFVSTLTS